VERRTWPLVDTHRARAPRELIAEGSIRHWAVSNFDPLLLEEVLSLCDSGGWPRPVMHQPSFSLLDRGAENELLPLCQAEGIAVAAYQVYAGGLLTGKYKVAAPVRVRHRDVWAIDWDYSAVALEVLVMVVVVTSCCSSRPAHARPNRHGWTIRSTMLPCAYWSHNVPRARLGTYPVDVLSPARVSLLTSYPWLFGNRRSKVARFERVASRVCSARTCTVVPAPTSMPSAGLSDCFARFFRTWQEGLSLFDYVVRRSAATAGITSLVVGATKVSQIEQAVLALGGATTTSTHRAML
jgi:hypothetical protein